MSEALHPTQPILIVGGGTFGLSTALHLAQNGHTSIHVLDKDDLPSSQGAGYDINKIIRSDYHLPLYAILAKESIEAWKKPPFSNNYHEVGWFTGAAATDKRGNEFVNQIRDVNQQVSDCSKVLESGQEIFNVLPKLDTSPCLNGWRGIYNPDAGWAHAKNALTDVYKEAVKLGVQFTTGESGTFTSFRVNSNSGKVDGVVAQDGSVYLADRIVMSMGAWTTSKIASGNQLRPFGYPVAHVQVSKEEMAQLKNMCVIHTKTQGYMFEPSEEGVVKIALPARYWNESPTNFQGNPNILTDSDQKLPEEAHTELRSLLGTFLPNLKDRPFAHEQLCWDSDTFDDNFLIDYHPQEAKVLYATGGSYHGFKFFPIIGKYITLALYGKLPKPLKEAWRWRRKLSENSRYSNRGQGETRSLRATATHHL